jgi:2-iminobutanoate/2-iminopropanoate deaminase
MTITPLRRTQGDIMTHFPKEQISSDKAPQALGPYSAGIRIGNLIFTAGQLGIIPSTGEFAPGGIEAETRQALENINAILVAAGALMSQVVKTTVFLRDMKDFSQMNNVYADFFTAPFPARSTVQVAALPKGGAVEIEVIAVIHD